MSYSAPGQVDAVWSNSVGVQNSMLSLATAAASALSNLSLDLPTVLISTTAAPTAPTLLESPSAPSVPDMSTVTAPDEPNLPELAEATVADVDIPEFDVATPDINYPTFNDIAFPSDPGNAPGLLSVDIPAAPDASLPEPPSWGDIVIPDAPSYILPVFEGSRPVLPAMTSPGQVFFYEEAAFSSPVWSSLQDRLLADLQSGGDVAPILDLVGMFAEQERWVFQDGVQRKEEIEARWRAKGWMTLPGAALAQLRLVDLDIEKTLAATRAQAVAKQAELTIQYRQFLIEQAGVVTANVALAAWNNGNQRAFEAAKLVAELAYQDLDAKIKINNAAIALYQADAAVFESRLKGALADLDAYKTTMEGARIRGELRDIDVKVYLGRLQGVQSAIEIYKGRLQGAATQAEINSQTLKAYESSIQGYVARVNAVRAQYDARVAQITGEKTKADVYTAQVGAYSARLGGAKTVAEIEATKAGVVAEQNKSLVSLYDASVRAFDAKWRGVATEIDNISKRLDAIVKLYAAESQAKTAENQARVQEYASATQAWATQANVSVEEQKLILSKGQIEAELRQKSLSVIAQVAGQGLSSALSQIHGSAALSDSTSRSESSSTSDVTSTTTSTSTNNSTSNSTATNYSYIQSMGV